MKVLFPEVRTRFPPIISISYYLILFTESTFHLPDGLAVPVGVGLRVIIVERAFMRTTLTFCLMCFIWNAGMATAATQQYPDRPVRLVVGFGAGGSADTTARVLAQKLSERWGQQVIVDNRAGAAGVIGMQVAAKAPRDGYTLMIGSATQLLCGPCPGSRAVTISAALELHPYREGSRRADCVDRASVATNPLVQGVHAVRQGPLWTNLVRIYGHWARRTT